MYNPLSPGCSSRPLKLIVFFESLGGVPVLSLPSVTSFERKYLSKPVDFFSSILPPSTFFDPIKIDPFRNVPVVSTNDFPKYSPLFPLAEMILLFFSQKSSTSSSIT